MDGLACVQLGQHRALPEQLVSALTNPFIQAERLHLPCRAAGGATARTRARAGSIASVARWPVERGIARQLGVLRRLHTSPSPPSGRWRAARAGLVTDAAELCVALRLFDADGVHGTTKRASSGQPSSTCWCRQRPARAPSPPAPPGRQAAAACQRLVHHRAARAARRRRLASAVARTRSSRRTRAAHDSAGCPTEAPR